MPAITSAALATQAGAYDAVHGAGSFAALPSIPTASAPAAPTASPPPTPITTVAQAQAAGAAAGAAKSAAATPTAASAITPGGTFTDTQGNTQTASFNPTTGLPYAPTTASTGTTTPSTTAPGGAGATDNETLASLLSTYQSALQPTAAMTATEQQAAALTEAQQNSNTAIDSSGNMDVGEKSGYESNIANQTNAQLTNLGTQYGIESQQQQATAAGAEAALETAKPITLSYGGSVYNPVTGTTSGGVFDQTSSPGSGGINPSTGLTSTASSSDILAYLSANGIDLSKYNSAPLVQAVMNGATAQQIISGQVSVAGATAAATSGATYQNNPQTGVFGQPNSSAASSAGSYVVPSTNLGTSGGSLQQGATGSNVSALQQFLVGQGYMTAAQVATGPGTYGPQTAAAVAAFQAANGVNTSGGGSGVFGPQTQAAAAAKGFGGISGGGAAPAAAPASGGTSFGTSAPAASSAANTYTIQPGDTFNSVAAKLGVNEGALQAANAPLNPNNLQVGQQIAVPAGAGSGGSSASSSSASSSSAAPATPFGISPTAQVSANATGATVIQYMQTGVMPSGLSPTDQKAVTAAAYAANPNFNPAAATANASALSEQVSYLATTQRAFNTATDNLAALQTFMQQNNINTSSSVPIINQLTDAVKAGTIDPGAIAAFTSSLTVLQQEYSQVLAKGGARSVSTDNEAQSLLPSDLSPSQLAEVASRISIDGNNAITETQNEIKTLTSGGSSSSSGGSSSSSSSNPLGI